MLFRRVWLSLPYQYGELEKHLKELFEALNTEKPEDVLNELYKISQYDDVLKLLDSSNKITEETQKRDVKIKELIIERLKNIHPQNSDFLDNPDFFFWAIFW